MKKILLGLLLLIFLTNHSFAITLKLSHQFPGGTGDARDEATVLISKIVDRANVGLKIQVYPGQSLYKAMEQYDALRKNNLDISFFPLDYAAGFNPSFASTLLPGLIRNHEHARKLNNSTYMEEIKETLLKDGIIVLSHAWMAGGIGSKNNCITNPDSIRGQVIRAAGPLFEHMFIGAGASISSVSSAQVYQSLQTGAVTAVNTSSQSFVSFRLYEQMRCITIPGKNTLWFMYQPILMSKNSFDQLNNNQKQVLLEAGKKAEEYLYKESIFLDQELEKIFKQKGVQVYQMTDTDFAAWMSVAKRTAYKTFYDKVAGGEKLVAKALNPENSFAKRETPPLAKRDPSPNRENDKNNRSQETRRGSDQNIKAGSGTGFFITNAGHIVSNNHVIDQCNVVNAYYKGDAKPLKILAIDRKNDLAILKAELRPDDTFPIAREDAILLEEIYVAGYPFGKSISGSVKVTKGVVSSLSGLGNNYSNIQIDASLQPGNSGGPIINKKGNVVGVAVAKLDYKKVIEAFNTIPENTNFGVKSSTLNQFLNANKVSSSSPKGSEMSIRDIGEKIEKATVYLDCWMTADKIQELKSKRVFFEE